MRWLALGLAVKEGGTAPAGHMAAPVNRSDRAGQNAARLPEEQKCQCPLLAAYERLSLDDAGSQPSRTEPSQDVAPQFRVFLLALLRS